MRQEMASEEQLLWVSVLSQFPIAAVEQVLVEFALDTPGDFLPRLKDVKARLVAMKPKGPSILDEIADLRKREAGGEKFYGLADVFKAVDKRERDAAGFPEVDYDARMAELRKQAAELLRGKA
jgi:hypothetical protein